MNRFESAVEAYLKHYGRIAIKDMVQYFGYSEDRQAQQDLNARWNNVFKQHGFDEYGKPKVVEMDDIEYFNSKKPKEE